MEVGGIERDYIVHDEERIHGFFGEYRFLSNYHRCKIEMFKIDFPSTENAYAAAKCLDPSRMKEFSKILPHEAKKLGGLVEMRPDWEKIKYDIMAAVVFQKFLRHKDLRERLMATGDRILEEGNHWGDRNWGMCDGFGENKLGIILMKTREFWK